MSSKYVSTDDIQAMYSLTVIHYNQEQSKIERTTEDDIVLIAAQVNTIVKEHDVQGIVNYTLNGIPIHPSAIREVVTVMHPTVFVDIVIEARNNNNVLAATITISLLDE